MAVIYIYRTTDHWPIYSPWTGQCKMAAKIRRLARKSRLGDDGNTTSLGNSYRLFAGHRRKSAK